mgnify:CR=1 FL=1
MKVRRWAPLRRRWAPGGCTRAAPSLHKLCTRTCGSDLKAENRAGKGSESVHPLIKPQCTVPHTPFSCRSRPGAGTPFR